MACNLRADIGGGKKQKEDQADSFGQEISAEKGHSLVSADSYTQNVTDCPEGKGQEVNGGKEGDYGNESVEMGGEIIVGETGG